MFLTSAFGRGFDVNPEMGILAPGLLREGPDTFCVGGGGGTFSDFSIKTAGRLEVAVEGQKPKSMEHRSPPIFVWVVTISMPVLAGCRKHPEAWHVSQPLLPQNFSPPFVLFFGLFLGPFVFH